MLIIVDPFQSLSSSSTEAPSVATFYKFANNKISIKIYVKA